MLRFSAVSDTIKEKSQTLRDLKFSLMEGCQQSLLQLPEDLKPYCYKYVLDVWTVPLLALAAWGIFYSKPTKREKLN